MKLKQHIYMNGKWTDRSSDPAFHASRCQLVLAFGSPLLIVKPEIYEYLKTVYPVADIVFSSTSGEIMGEDVFDESVVATAIQFEKTRVHSVSTNIKKHTDSFETGAFLMDELAKEEL